MRRSGSKSLDELSTFEIIKICEQNYEDYWRCIGQSPNAQFSQSDGITRCITGLPQEMFNVVLNCRLLPPTIDERIDSMIDHFRSRQLILIWHVGVLTEPDDLGTRLEARGYPHDYDLTAMAIDLDSVTEEIEFSERISVRAVENAEDCAHWVECLTRSWESPAEVAAWMLGNACFNLSLERNRQLSLPRRMYLGMLDGVPVGSSMLFWSGDYAGLQDVGTIHSGRGKGVGAAILRAIAKDARGMGFRCLVVLSTVEGVGMYKKAGFREFGKLPEHSMDFRADRT